MPSLTQFQPHVVGVKTSRMLEVEARLGRTLEQDFQEYYVEKEWGQKKISKRWGVTRAAIFGRKITTEIKCWVQVLQLPIRREEALHQLKEPKLAPSCEICGTSGVPLEGAHWIAASKGGNATPSNIIKLCPNCHTKLDLSEDADVTAKARAVLLIRVSRGFVESPQSFNKLQQLQFVELCKSIIDRQ